MKSPAQQKKNRGVWVWVQVNAGEDRTAALLHLMMLQVFHVFAIDDVYIPEFYGTAFAHSLGSIVAVYSKFVSGKDPDKTSPSRGDPDPPLDKGIIKA